MKMVSTNPARNYEIVGEVEASTDAEVYQAVAAARVAQSGWAALTLEKRMEAVKSFVDQVRALSEEFAKIICEETGRPILSARADVAKGIACFDGYLATAVEYLAPKVTYETETELHYVVREPWGVVAAICPWNFPFTNVAWQCGQALIAGNTIVYKNSEENPLFAKLLAEIVVASDLPQGVLTVLYGDGHVGEMLARANVDKISFTGSYPVGQKLAMIAAEKFIPITAELGGSNPYIVFPNTEITDGLIADLYGRRFNHSGQFCTSLKRLIVHESLFDEVVARLKTMCESKQIGDPRLELTDLGPVVSKRQLRELEDQVADAVAKGAKIVTGGKRPPSLEGAYYEPTILTNITPDMRVWCEETFGPVLPVVSFANEDEAVQLANDTEYGLSAYLSTPDKEQFKRVAGQLQAGMIAEGSTVNLVAAHNPFGGYKHSGMGRENGAYGFEDATQTKLISEMK